LKKCLKPFLRGFFSKYPPFRVLAYEICKKSVLNKHLIIKMRSEDYFLLVNTRDHWSLQPIKRGIVETPEDKFIKENRLIREGDTVIDVGAHWGGFSIFFAKLTGINGKVYSFEASSRNFKYLKKNVCLNNLKDTVKIYRYAVGSKDGYVNLGIAKTSSGHNSIVRDNLPVQDYEKVKLISLDRFVEENKIKNINFIKIDVEGYELEVLKGFEKTLKDLKNFWMFIEYSPSYMGNDEALELLEIFKRYFNKVYIGYKKKIYETNWSEVKELSFKTGLRNLFLYKSK